MEIGNIFCVGRNYVQHAEELGNTVPERPLLFTKPTHSAVFADGRTIVFPKDSGDIHYEVEIVLCIGREPGETVMVNDVVTQMALGIDFTMRDVQSRLKAKGHPWLLSKGFKNAAVLTDFWTFPGEDVCRNETFSLIQNGKLVQTGKADAMIFDFQTLLTYINTHFGLHPGDVVFTGTPAGVGSVMDQDVFCMKWGGEIKGQVIVSQ